MVIWPERAGLVHSSGILLGLRALVVPKVGGVRVMRGLTGCMSRDFLGFFGVLELVADALENYHGTGAVLVLVVDEGGRGLQAGLENDIHFDGEAPKLTLGEGFLLVSDLVVEQNSKLKLFGVLNNNRPYFAKI